MQNGNNDDLDNSGTALAQEKKVRKEREKEGILMFFNAAKALHPPPPSQKKVWLLTAPALQSWFYSST